MSAIDSAVLSLLDDSAGFDELERERADYEASRELKAEEELYIKD